MTCEQFENFPTRFSTIFERTLLDFIGHSAGEPVYRVYRVDSAALRLTVAGPAFLLSTV